MKNYRSFNEIVNELQSHPNYVKAIIYNTDDIINYVIELGGNKKNIEKIKKIVENNKKEIRELLENQYEEMLDNNQNWWFDETNIFDSVII
jgi:hypothetical protein